MEIGEPREDWISDCFPRVSVQCTRQCTHGYDVGLAFDGVSLLLVSLARR